MAKVLVRAHQRQLLHIKQVTAKRLGVLWDKLPDYRDAELFTQPAVQIVEAAQSATVRLADAYLARSMSVPVLGLDPAQLIGGMARNGADMLQVYERPFHQLWFDLAEGKPFTQALVEARDRMLATSDVDVQLAAREANLEWARQAQRDYGVKVYGWQRITNEGACDFCELASTQAYKTDDLQPLHNRCNCDVAPLQSPPDGKVIDQDKLDELRDKGVVVYRGDGERQFYGDDQARAIAVQTQQHGELGPVLVNGNDNFRGPGDVMGGQSADDFAGWAEGQGWSITTQNDTRIEGERDGQTIAWEKVTPDPAVGRSTGAPVWRKVRD